MLFVLEMLIGTDNVLIWLSNQKTVFSSAVCFISVLRDRIRPLNKDANVY